MAKSKAIQLTHKKYAYEINSRNGWSGHLCQERFYSSAVDYPYALKVAKYIERNPVKAGIVLKSTEYKWSSARHNSGLEISATISTTEEWERERRKVDTWSDWLTIPNSDGDANHLRKATTRDLPFDTDAFIKEQEKKLGGSLAIRNRGRPRKK